ncbi:MAG TPA: hypothetical protein VI585_11855 [Candidatus Binatia bacterium]
MDRRKNGLAVNRDEVTMEHAGKNSNSGKHIADRAIAEAHYLLTDSCSIRGVPTIAW